MTLLDLAAEMNQTSWQRRLLLTKKDSALSDSQGDLALVFCLKTRKGAVWWSECLKH